LNTLYLFYISSDNWINVLSKYFNDCLIFQINKKAREAELSLIQFQYDGPLPTVSAGSQSGAPKQVPASAGAAPASSSSSTTE
jgi:hypothetical protein